MQDTSDLDRPPEADSSGDGSQPDALATQLLEAAVLVFGERGIDAARATDVARRCGLTTGAIYSRWKGKRELFSAAIEHVSTENSQFLLDMPDADISDKYTALAQNLLASVHDDVRALMVEACASAHRDQAQGAAVVDALAAEAGELSGKIEQAKAEGLVDDSLDTNTLALLCQALGFGTHLVLGADSNRRDGVDGDEWNRLVLRLVSALAPQPIPEPGTSA